MKYWRITSKEDFFKLVVKYKEENLQQALLGKESYYGEKIILPKKNGIREVYNVDKEHSLYKIQKNIANNFLNNIMVSDATCGFIKGSSYYDFLEPHIDFYCESNYLRLDISNFFGTITRDMVYDALEFYCQIENQEEKEEVLEILCDILTYNDILIQGCVTSPMLSNIVFRKVDIRILKYCNKCNVKYTRYADDLLFSSTNSRVLQNSFCKGINKIVKDNGFKINYDKKIKGKGYISLNGFVVSDSIRISRKKLKEINRVVFYLKSSRNHMCQVKQGDIDKINQHIEKETGCKNRFNGTYTLVNYLNGYRAFLISTIQKSEDNKFIDRAMRLVSDIEYCVDGILS